MKVIGLLISGLLLAFGEAVALDVAPAGIPDCATPCLSGILSSIGSSSTVPLPDSLCSNITLQSSLSTCVQKSCSFNEQIIGTRSMQSFCKGHPIKSRSNEMIICIVVLSAITFPTAGLKFYTRWSASRRLGLDDYAALLSTVFLAGLAATLFACAKLGLGQHYWTIKPENAVHSAKSYYVGQMLYIIIQVLAKISLLLLYVRLFPRTRTEFMSKLGIAFLLLHGTVYLFLIIFQCWPIHAIWDRSIAGQCLHPKIIGYSGAGASILEDFFILFLPAGEIWNLQLSRGQKLNLFFMFSIGSFACVTSIVRLQYLSVFDKQFDATWDHFDFVLWSLIEEFVAVFCACIPSLRAFIVKIFLSVNTHVQSTVSGIRSGTHGAQRLDNSTTTSFPMYSITKSVGVDVEEKPATSDGYRSGSTTRIYANG
ncbi:uncharacterized protein L3040_004176 [Drepanopeziza brunnea f. sp. 'multigermtubi']|uniref:uncharacterized protein n=1 Tax=Drepanopeziza brunnea f. sp. 'multigermtubi' TaxID=698441 RepID=UPI00239FAE79|nr:hypothetical protein L3040_004176 [Drepanopeziza brunnea f. sp. 'multigermtubi']